MKLEVSESFQIHLCSEACYQVSAVSTPHCNMTAMVHSPLSAPRKSPDIKLSATCRVLISGSDNPEEPGHAQSCRLPCWAVLDVAPDAEICS